MDGEPAGPTTGRPPVIDDTAERRPAIDVARILALVVVVLGHLLLAVIDRGPDGEVRGDNLLALHPNWAWVAVLAPMPVFFAAGGWANATATIRSSARRLDALVGLGAVVVTLWSTLVVIVGLTTHDTELIGGGARLATEPLWFLAAYVPFTAAGRTIARVAATHVVVSVGGALAVLAALDVARFGHGAPRWIGWVGFFLAWGVPWMLGSWWRHRHATRPFDERLRGAALLAAAAVAGWALVRWGGYSPGLIDTGAPGRRSNTTPPGLYTAVAAVGQVGVFLLLAGPLDRLGLRFRRLWSRAGEAAVGIYVWHLTAMALCVGLVALGLPAPTRLTASWWWTRPLWWALVLGVTAAIVALSAWVRGRLAARHRPRPMVSTVRLALGVVAATAGAARVGINGPRTVDLALECTALFVLGWWLLRVAPDTSPDTTAS